MALLASSSRVLVSVPSRLLDPLLKNSSRESECLVVCRQKDISNEEDNSSKVSRRETIVRSSCSILLLSCFRFGGTRPNYLGVGKNPPALALCPPTPNCISTSEVLDNPSHFIPPWTYNPKDGRGGNNSVSREQALKELLEVIKSTKPDNYSPTIIEQRDDYIYVEYASPVLGFVDDVEFWFPPGNQSVVEYRSASRFGQIDFGINRKRIMTLRLALQKQGWQSVGY